MNRSIRENLTIMIAAAAVLIAALAIASDRAYASTWPSYRGNDCNNGVIAALTPIEQKTTEPYWINKFGKSSGGMVNWDKAPTVPIIVDDDVITTSGTEIIRLDAKTGKKSDSGKMTYKADWGYTPLTYVEVDRVGYVFCPLANGTIDVFDVDNLSKGPLWTFRANEKNDDGSSKWGLTPELTVEDYKETHKGEEPPAELMTPDGNVYANKSVHQSLSPIVYSDGIIYTGFFTYPHNYFDYYVAIAARDITIEDPWTGETTDYHTGDLIWKYKSKGGFYWNGAVVIGDAVIVGTQDGLDGSEAGNGRIISFDKYTGEIISEHEIEGSGDICSSIVYDKDFTGKLFWTGAAGCICKASIDPELGIIDNVDVKWLARPKQEPTTVSTPVIYKGRAYIGFREKGVNGYFAAYDAMSEDEPLREIFKAELPTYSKSSPLLTYAYEESTKYLYAYMASYDIPGGVVVIKFRNNAKTSSEVEVSQLFAANGYEEYGACSLIANDEGHLYYKNDSQSIFAIRSCKELKLATPTMKLSPEKGKVTVSFKKVKNATGYRLLYRKNETGSFKRVNLSSSKTKYVIKGLKNGTVVSVKMRAEHVDAAKKVYGSYTAIKDTYAAKSTIKKLTGGKGNFTIQYDKHKIAEGYQIQYAPKKSMSGAVSFTVSGASKTKYKKTNVVGGKTYYVRVRSYKMIGQKKVNGKWTGGTAYYGKWSSKKKVKVKKVPVTTPSYSPYTSPYSRSTSTSTSGSTL